MPESDETCDSNRSSDRAFNRPAERRQFLPISTRKYGSTVVLGLLSALLYDLLYQFSGDLTDMAQATHAGQKGAFFIPIIIALVFSIVHGSFTGKFWETLGVKPKRS